MKTYFFIFILGIILNNLIVIKTFSQTVSENQNTKENLISDVNLVYGADQRIINGTFFENNYRNDMGHPYYFSNDFVKGYVIIRNKKYQNINLKYNIFNQSILLYIITPDNKPSIFTPPNNFISEFNLNNKVFRKYKFDGLEDCYYQVLYNGNIKCLYYWYKKREESYNHQRYANFKYLNEKKKKYIVIDNKLNRYRYRIDFLKIFPKEYKKDILKFIKSNNIKLTKSSDIKISKLVAFCEDLIFDVKENNSNIVDN